MGGSLARLTRVKPFLLLATRAEDAAADNEYEAFLAYSGLDEARLVRHRLEHRPLGEIELDAWSGILLGGSPFNCTDPVEAKSVVQLRVEADLAGLLDAVVAADFPLLGACYGIGTSAGTRARWSTAATPNPLARADTAPSRAGRTRCWRCRTPSTPSSATRRRSAPCPTMRCSRRLATCPVQLFRISKQRLRHAVPPRARRRRAVHPGRRPTARRVLRSGARPRDQGDGPAQHGHPPADPAAQLRRPVRRGETRPAFSMIPPRTAGPTSSGRCSAA